MKADEDRERNGAASSKNIARSKKKLDTQVCFFTLITNPKLCLKKILKISRSTIQILKFYTQISKPQHRYLENKSGFSIRRGFWTFLSKENKRWRRLWTPTRFFWFFQRWLATPTQVNWIFVFWCCSTIAISSDFFVNPKIPRVSNKSMHKYCLETLECVWMR